MKNRSAAFSLTLVLAVGPVAGAWAGELYKWVDENGVTNYSDAPPPKTARKAVALDETKSTLSVVPGLSKEEVAGIEARAERSRNDRLEQENAELRARLAATPARAPAPPPATESAPVVVAPIVVRRPPADHHRSVPRAKPVEKTVPPPAAMRLER